MLPHSVTNMTDRPRSALDTIKDNPRVTWMIFTVLMLVVLAVSLRLPGLQGRDELVDYDAFHIVGLMALEGEVGSAYDLAQFLEAQRRHSDAVGFMPWAYPPTFNLLVAPLALLPRGLGYALFTGLPLIAWFWVILSLSGRRASWVMVMLLPALAVQTLVGQNGYLSGALVGLFCTAMLRRKDWGGVPLGLMIIKPHLALGLGLMALLQRRLKALGLAFATALGLSALATMVFGPAIWPQFLVGTRQASGFLADGAYPLFRMTSLYAMLHQLGLSPGVAMAAQGVLALGVASLVAWASSCPTLTPRGVLALACAGGLLFSPYGYDYDLPVLGVALALAAPELLNRARESELRLMLVLTWITGGAGSGIKAVMDLIHPEGGLDNADLPTSPAGLTLILLVALMARVLSRAPAADCRDTRPQFKQGSPQ